MQVVKVVVWEEKGTWLGYLQEYPDYMTQGETLEDLRAHLKDLYHEFVGGQVPGIRKVEDLVVA
jgi:predicted RNase H-like HicB family nuclease